MLTGSRKIRVLIVDDSAVVRKILSETLSAARDIEVVGTARDPIIAGEMIERLRPDVLTLDVEMPRMNGLEFLQYLMRTKPMPVIMISSITQRGSVAAVEALAEGAVEVLAKPHGPYSVGDFQFTLADKVRNAASARLRRRGMGVAAGPVPPARTARVSAQVGGGLNLIAIGASTGGTEAIERILRDLPSTMPPIVVVQHIPAGFSKAFAERLDRLCELRVREAVNGDVAEPGLALVAPGNFHMRVVRMGNKYRVSISDGPLVCYQRPAVDVLFDSIAEAAPKQVVALLLTGMGSDGAAAMKRLRTAPGASRP